MPEENPKAVTPEDSKRKQKENWIQVLKFTLLSLSAGLVDYVSFALLGLIRPPWSYEVKEVLSVTLSVIWNFTLNRRYTFRSANNVPIAMLKVGLFYLFFIPAAAWLGGLVTDTGVSQDLVKIVTMLLNGVLEFVWWKFVVFRGSENTNDIAKKKEAERLAKAAKEREAK